MPGGQSAYDTLRYNESSNPPEYPDFTAKDVQYIKINDQQNGSYGTGQITMDLNAVTSSFRFIDWKNSYWEIPVSITLTNTGEGAGVAGTGLFVDRDLAAAISRSLLFSLKSHYLTLIDSMTVICGNQQLISRQSGAHIPIHYNLLTKFNKLDVEAFGPSIGFYGVDNTEYNGATSVGVDNIGFDQCDSFDDPVARRRALASLDFSKTYDAAHNVLMAVPGPHSVFAGTGATVTGDNVADVVFGSRYNKFQKYVTKDTIQKVTREPLMVATSAAIMTLEFAAIIPMCYLHDLFDKMPLVRGALWQLQLNLHLPFTCNFAVSRDVLNTTAVTAQRNLLGCTISGSAMTVDSRTGYVPAHVSLKALGYCLGLAAVNAATYSLQGSVTNSSGTVTTLHCAMVDFEPGPGTTYLKDPVKTVVFKDYQQIRPASGQGVAPGTNVTTFPITPGMSKLRGLLIVPEAVNASGDPVVATAGKLPSSAFRSPFNTAGATAAPYARYVDFQVTVAGRRLFDQNISYGFEQFMQQQFGVGSPSGNGVDGLRTGLINQENWSKNYGFVWVNLERHAETSDGMPMPVEVSFRNGNTYSMNYTFYLFYEKEFKIDVLSGRVMI